MAIVTQETARWPTKQQNRHSAAEKHDTIVDTPNHLQLLYPKWTANSNSNEMDLRFAIMKALSAMKTVNQHETVERPLFRPEMMAVGV